MARIAGGWVRHVRGIRRSRPVLAVGAFVVAFSIIGAGSIVVIRPAYAVDYPSWEDVQAARQNQAATQAEVTRVQSLLDGLKSAADSTRAIAEQKGNEYQAAQLKFDEANFKAAELQKQADAARENADKSRLQAGQFAARQSRTAGDDISARLFFSGADAKSLLSQLGLASMLKNQASGLYEKAIQDQNTAQSLTDQADVAKAALGALAAAAQKALDEATVAAAAAATAFQEQQDNNARLRAQLATLTTNVDHLETEYVDGLRAIWGDEVGLDAGKISTTGWVRPAGGHISSPFGFRINPFTHSYAFHAGTDFGASCNSPIFAAHSGVVEYAGPNGGYGNFVLIADGDGVSTGYGHIVDGGVHVTVGQKVTVGQPIALVGSTGHSTGCHLHYETRRDGVAFDAVPFMRSNGIELAN